MLPRLPVILFVCALLDLSWVVAVAQSGEQDSSAALPKEYAGKYLIARTTLSPDENFAVIYPKQDDKKAQNFLVGLKPFRILGPLETKWPYIAGQSHGGISAEWAIDSSVALVTLASKWGPADVFLYEITDGALTRSTNLLGQVRERLAPDFAKAKPTPYNDTLDFIFEGDGTDVCHLDGNRVRINALATTDPKRIAGLKAWDARFEAVWDIPRGRFVSPRVSTLFSGVRKEE
jgi:hypothetical protein